MPIVINGSGSITGISVGGLPDGCVQIADLATTGTASGSTFLRGDAAFAEAGGCKILQAATKTTTTGASNSNAGAGDYVVLTSDAITVSAGSTILIFGNYHVWMQNNSNPFYGSRKIQREIGGSGSWSDVRGAGGSTFEYQMQSATLNADSNLQCINAVDTHGQNAGTSLKYRIVHTSSVPNPCSLLVFQRNGNESNIMMMEVGS